MPEVIRLSKSDARRALVRHHFLPCATQIEAFSRLRSVQFDPIAPVGCNHDLVLQARVADYRVGDWEKLAYQERAIYDGWDKQASLVPFSGWTWRQAFHRWHRGHFQKIFDEHSAAVDSVLANLESRGPLMPKECEFQGRDANHQGTWGSANLTKQVLRALWHTGQVMTAGRRKGQHLYDLTERVLPVHLHGQPIPDDDGARQQLVLERHLAMGLLRLAAPMEVWAYKVYTAPRAAAVKNLIGEGRLVEVEVEGVKAHATPEFLSHLDAPPLEPRAIFIAPLDQFVWDRKMIAHLFGFDYVWEIYVPEVKRRWGYYVLPILYGDDLVARAEFSSRNGVLELRQWHNESGERPPGFYSALEESIRNLMVYSGASQTAAAPGINPKIQDLFSGL